MVSKIFSNNISQFNVSTFQTSQITFVNPRIQNFFQITFAIPQLLNFSQFHLLVNGTVILIYLGDSKLGDFPFNFSCWTLSTTTWSSCAATPSSTRASILSTLSGEPPFCALYLLIAISVSSQCPRYTSSARPGIESRPRRRSEGQKITL